MKQSKKLLSIFLAMLMLLGTVSVIGNAAQQKVTEETKGEIKYDSVDNAALTADQVAFIILDMLDNDVMPGLGKMDLSILGSLDLTSVDNALSSVYDLLGGFLLGLLAGGDADTLIDQRKQLLFKGTDNKEDVVCRADGDLQVVYQLLQFIGNENVAGVLAKAPKGLLTSNGINIGTLNGIVAGFVDLSSINDILTNIPGFLGTMVFDMLLYGSYGYDKDSEELKGQLPSSADTLDEIVNEAVTGLLTKPQKYSYVDGVKTWDTDSKILNLTATEIAALDLNIAKNSIFSILDKALPIAYETFGTVVLNHDVKKIFMEAMGVDFVRITDEAEIARIKTTSATNAINKYIDVETAERELKENGNTNIDTSSVKNYFCNAQMWKVGDTWYFRDYVTTEIGTDDDDNPITDKIHRFFKAQTYSVDDLYEVFNWDYYLTADSLDFVEMLKAADGNDSYGSLVGSLNHIIHVIFENAISSEFLTSKDTSVDALWADGDNSNFNENLMNTAKFLLINYTFMFFGRNEAYVDLETLEPKQAFVNKINSFDSESAIDREGLIAYMLLPFLGDALPQLVYSADMFEDGLQIEQVAALLVREFLTDLTPQISGEGNDVLNYDAQIFVDPSLKTGRRLIEGQSSDYWMNLVLNMGLDLAAVYLDNIANFNVDLNTLKTFHTYAKEKSVQPWQVVLEEIVDWAVLYVGSGSNSVIKGLEPSTLGVVRNVTAYDHTNDKVTVANNYNGNAFATLSKALNTLLPLGIVNGCSTKNYSLDVEVLFNKIKGEIIPSLDLEALIGLFGRNVDPNGNNFLANTNIPYQIVSIVNKVLGAVLGKTILQAGDAKNTTPLNTMLQADNLGTTIKNLVMGLNDRKVPLLTSVLPVLAIFVSGWGTEQELGSPEIALGDTITADDSGNITDYSVNIRNGSAGIWRSYMATDGNGNVTGNRAQDNQYSYKITNVSATVLNKKATVSGIEFTKNAIVKYGGKTTFTFDASGVPEYGALVRFVVTYTVFDETNTEVVDGLQFNKVQYCFINRGAQAGSSTKAEVELGSALTGDLSYITVTAPTYIYINDTDVNSLSTQKQISGVNSHKNKGTGSFTAGSTNAQGGIALKSASFDLAANGGSYSGTMFGAVSYTGETGVDGTYYSFTGNKIKAVRPKVDWLNGEKSDETSFDLTVVIYSGEYKSKLEGLVSDELGRDRKEYNFSKSSFAVPEEYTEDDTNYYNSKTIDGAAAWNEYTEALYLGATRVFQRERTAVSLKTLDYKSIYERLYKAVNDLDVCELSDAEKMEQEVAHGAIAPDTAVEYVKGFLDSAEEKIGEKDYRTYMLYRWNKYTSVRKSINNAIELQKRAKTPAETQRFPYRDISIAELNEILAMDAYKGYASYVTALLEDLSEDEIARNAKEHADAVRDYARLDIAEQAVNAGYITMAANRLIKRTSAPVTYYLEKEIASAENQIGKADATNTKYSAKSWDIYVEALKAAKTAMASDSQDAIFNAKYQLQVARNGLILAVDEADYKELDTLIDQAKNALATHTGNKNIYKNSDEDFGKLLAALGLEVTNSNGDTFELFPGAALEVQSTPYSSHDQDEVDDAADELKAALAKLEYNNFSSKKPDKVNTTEIETGEKDANDNPIKESIYTTTIDQKQISSTVVDIVKGNNSDWTVQVSLDEKYSATDGKLESLPVGTGATVTVFKKEGTVVVPVATIKVIVKGDVTGDGVVDALDCMIADLCISNQASLGGVYFIAGDLAQNNAIDTGDFTQIVNEAVKVS